MNEAKFTVMLLDDHPAIMYGIAMAIDLEDDMTVSAQCSDAESAIKVISREGIDIVLVDISLEGGTDGFDFIKAVNERHNSVKTLVLSMHDEAFYAEKAILAGAKGYITKKEPIQEIITGIREVMKGNLYIPGDLSGKLILKLMRKGQGEEMNLNIGLTPREREVMQYIRIGYTPVEIARELKLSVNTVETHRKNLKDKLGLSSCRELFKYAIKTSDS